MTTMGGGWLTEGTAHRTRVQPAPVIHVLIAETDEMWCSGGKGRRDAPYGNRLCSKCRALVREAVADDMLASEDAARWL